MNTKRALCLALAASTALAGCTTMPARRVTTNFYPHCYEPVAYIRQSEDSFRHTVAGAALAGAVLGGIAGALLSGGKNSGQGALIGALSGAAIGGGGAYAHEKAQQGAEDRAHLGAAARDLNRDLATLNRVEAAASAAQSCYNDEFKQLLAAKRAGRVNHNDGHYRLHEIVSGLTETNEMLMSVDSQFGQNVQAYQEAYDINDQRPTPNRRRQVADNPPSAAPQALNEVPRAREKLQAKARQGQDQLHQTCQAAGDWGANVPGCHS